MMSNQEQRDAGVAKEKAAPRHGRETAHPHPTKAAGVIEFKPAWVYITYTLISDKGSSNK
jgi:hypothetical protein